MLNKISITLSKVQSAIRDLRTLERIGNKLKRIFHKGS